MSFNMNGSQFLGAGNFVQVEPGTHECVLLSAEAYLNDRFNSTETQPQLTLIWDTETVGERDDGSEVDLVIYDSFLNLSLNEKAKLVNRFHAVSDFEPDSVDMQIVFDNDAITGPDHLPHRTDRKEKVNNILLNGESIFGKRALVEVTLNDNGYTKVKSVSKPLAAKAKRRKVLTEPEAQEEAIPGL